MFRVTLYRRSAYICYFCIKDNFNEIKKLFCFCSQDKYNKKNSNLFIS